jgi:hypothetical protein
MLTLKNLSRINNQIVLFYFCGGQNKSNNMICFGYCLESGVEHSEEVELKFPVPVHSFLNSE